MAIEINPTDVASAATFLENLLAQNVPNGRFTQGTALRDLTVNALAYVFAQIRKDNEDVRSLQSLLTAPNLNTGGDPDRDKAVSNAVDAILSNWFITRKAGSFARGLVNIYVTKYQDYLLPANTRFLYSGNLAYYPDVVNTNSTVVISATDLQPVISSTTGAVDGYFFTQRLVAARTGVEYNVNPALWISGKQFSPFATRVINTEAFAGGKTRESSTEMISRANNAISVRNLINVRSIDAVLREKFSTINYLQVIGYGDPEMQRDKAVETASGIDLHIGGHTDIYVDLPRTTVTFQGLVGGRYVRPDRIINVFRDSTIVDWTATVVKVGDVIRVADGLADSPRDFVIREVLPTELRVSKTSPFSQATDEISGAYLDYFIYRPLFGADVQLLPTVGINATGQSSRAIQNENRVTLPGGAHYRILDVAVVNPDPADTFISADGLVHFPVRVPDAPVAVANAVDLQYQVVNNDPPSAQSMIQFEELLLQSAYNGKTVRVKYETVVGMGAIHDFTRDRFERILCANPLVKAYIPVYISCVIPWRIKPTAVNPVNLTALNTAVVTFINNFDRNDTLDVSDITQVVKDTDPNVGTVFIFPITYDLIVPDGRVLRYTTDDIVSIDPTKLIIDPTTVNNGLTDPLSQCISSRTIRLLTTPDRISFEER
jgi:hypothetical protein